nr:hypothetical protein [Tanacetum cinerariifolium]
MKIGKEIDEARVEFTSSWGGIFGDGKDIKFWVDRIMTSGVGSGIGLEKLEGEMKMDLGEDRKLTVKDLSRWVEEKSLHMDSVGQETLWNKLWLFVLRISLSLVVVLLRNQKLLVVILLGLVFEFNPTTGVQVLNKVSVVKDKACVDKAPDVVKDKANVVKDKPTNVVKDKADVVKAPVVKDKDKADVVKDKSTNVFKDKADVVKAYVAKEKDKVDVVKAPIAKENDKFDVVKDSQVFLF